MTNLLSADQITVLGGPSTIDVNLDFGPTGQRGSFWFVGNGNPNSPSTTIGQTPKIFDMYINLDNADTEYLSLYQYQNGVGSNSWVKLVNLIPNIFSKNLAVEFNAGNTSIKIPLISILPQQMVGSAVVTNFNVQHSIVNSVNPISSTLNILNIIEDNGVLSLNISLSAIQYNGSSWENLTGQRTVHLFISVV